ncbi:MAG: SLC13 family permease [Planctomycetota bacterium]|nr:SLC13 family permease [Planctomycetota bacterium]
MTPEQWIALGTLAVATTLFITRPIPLAMTALSIPVVLWVAGIVDRDQALGGFGNQAVLAIGAIMVIGGALRESGVATLIARGLQRVGGTGEAGLIALLMVSTSLLAAFMNNTAVVAILLPVVAALSRRSGVAASKLLMPVAFAAVLGGTISLIGTAPNFLVADYYNNPLEGDAPERPIQIFDFATVGIAITITGTIFMILIGRRFLPEITAADRREAARLPMEAAESYGIGEKLFKLKVAESSSVLGKTIAEVDVRKRYDLAVVMVRRPAALGERWLQPEPSMTLELGDIVYVQGPWEKAWEFSEEELCQFGLASERAVERLLGHGTSMADVSVPPYSRALGRSFKGLDFRKRYGLNVLALWRRNEAITEGVADVELELGDSFLVSGTADQVAALQENRDFVVLTDLSEEENLTRAPIAIIFMLLALLPPVLLNWPLPITALGAAILMVAFGCIQRTSLLRSIDWKVLAMIIGTLPLGVALDQVGIAGSVAEWFRPVNDALGLTGVYGVLFLITATLSVLTSNAAAAVIMAPVAAKAATLIGLDPRNALLAMAYGCSCNFLLPFAQCNLLVMGPGGYGTKDFIRVGIGLSIVMAITTIGMLAYLG